MKIFNISDVETKTLKQHGLVNHAVVVGKALLSPGQSVEVPDNHVQHKLEGIDKLVKLGVLAIGQPPKGYIPAPVVTPKEGSAPVPAKTSKAPPPSKRVSE